MTFFRNRVVPQTPPSFEKFSRNDASEMIGLGSSMPTSDQVPELMNAAPGEPAAAAKAAAVSCVAEATTGVLLNEPMTDPASTTGERSLAGRSRRSINDVFHVRLCGS